MPRPHTEFNWTIYANATLAGLTPLIPLPVVDWAFEEFFRRRMLPAIAHCRNCDLSPAVIAEFVSRENSNRGCLDTCLTWPLKGLLMIARQLSRKILYFLAIQEATDKLSYYWHIAFLMDYMVLADHLHDEQSAKIAEKAMYHLLEEQTTTSPLRQLARQITASTRHVFRSLIGARRGEEDGVIEQKKLQMVEHWADFSEYFELLAARYERIYQRYQTQDPEGDAL